MKKIYINKSVLQKRDIVSNYESKEMTTEICNFTKTVLAVFVKLQISVA